MNPRIPITCPRCGSLHAMIALERTDSQSCFCPGCQHLWQIPTRLGPAPR